MELKYNQTANYCIADYKIPLRLCSQNYFYCLGLQVTQPITASASCVGNGAFKYSVYLVLNKQTVLSSMFCSAPQCKIALTGQVPYGYVPEIDLYFFCNEMFNAPCDLTCTNIYIGG